MSLSEKDRKRAAELYEKGASSTALGIVFGVASSTIRRHLPPGMVRSKTSKGSQERELEYSNAELHKMIEDGERIIHLAPRVGLTASGLSRRMKKYRRRKGLAGFTQKAREKVLKYSNQELDEMRRSGRKLKNIAEEVGMTPEGVRLRIERWRNGC